MAPNTNQYNWRGSGSLRCDRIDGQPNLTSRLNTIECDMNVPLANCTFSKPLSNHDDIGISANIDNPKSNKQLTTNENNNTKYELSPLDKESSNNSYASNLNFDKFSKDTVSVMKNKPMFTNINISGINISEIRNDFSNRSSDNSIKQQQQKKITGDKEISKVVHDTQILYNSNDQNYLVGGIDIIEPATTNNNIDVNDYHQIQQHQEQQNILDQNSYPIKNNAMSYKNQFHKKKNLTLQSDLIKDFIYSDNAINECPGKKHEYNSLPNKNINDEIDDKNHSSKKLILGENINFLNTINYNNYQPFLNAVSTPSPISQHQQQQFMKNSENKHNKENLVDDNLFNKNCSNNKVS